MTDDATAAIVERLDAVLSELRVVAAWARLRPMLDTLRPVASPLVAVTVGEIAAEALDRGDEATVAALERELPAYLEARLAPLAVPDVLDAIATARKEARS